MHATFIEFICQKGAWILFNAFFCNRLLRNAELSTSGLIFCTRFVKYASLFIMLNYAYIFCTGFVKYADLFNMLNYAYIFCTGFVKHADLFIMLNYAYIFCTGLVKYADLFNMLTFFAQDL